MFKILSQSANGRAIDASDLISGNANYIDAGDDKMIVLLHKPEVPAAGQPFVDERVFLELINEDSHSIEVRIDFNGAGEEFTMKRGERMSYEQVVRGYSSEAVVSVYKRQGDALLVRGGAEA